MTLRGLTKNDVDAVRASDLFDADWYLETYPDVKALGMDPVEHYLWLGTRLNRNPSPKFDSADYLSRNADVAADGINPLLHYLRFGASEGRAPKPTALYAQWQNAFDYSSKRGRQAYLKAIGSLSRRPLISVLMPVYNTPSIYLETAIGSVKAQIYPDWELCIADDASTAPRVRRLLEDAMEYDDRIKIVFRPKNGHISEATNSAFQLASGEYIALLDHDDILREHALAEIAIALEDHPNAVLIYTDEDKIDENGQRYDPHFKPDYSLDLFRSMNYLNHLTVYRTENIHRVGGWRRGFEGSQDYDLNLRIIETIDQSQIVHIPKILYHWRAIEGSTAFSATQKDYPYKSGFRALEEHVVRTKLSARVERVANVPFYRLTWPIPAPAPLVSLIIPTRDKVDILKKCINSIIGTTTYSNLDIIIVDNDSREAKTLTYFDKISQNPRVRILSYPHPFNYSAINNFAARHARGEILGLINNDIEAISPDWLDEMVSHAVRKEIGCVGAKLYYPSNTIQHAGVTLGVGGVAGHTHRGRPKGDPGYFGRLRVAHNCSAVTGACLLVRTDIFWEVGGLDEIHLKVAFNDVDFCIKVREAGYRNLFTPFAELYHCESLSRGSDDTPEQSERFKYEVGIMQQRWGRQLNNDPYYSPNLTRARPDFSIRNVWELQMGTAGEIA